MVMNNVSNFLSEQLGEEVTVGDIREGDLSEKISKANEINRILAAKKGQFRLQKEQIKLQKKLEKLNKKMAALKEEQK